MILLLDTLRQTVPRTSKTAPKKVLTKTAKLPSFSLLKPDTPALKPVLPVEDIKVESIDLPEDFIEEFEEEREEGSDEEEYSSPEEESPSSTMKFGGEAEILGVPVDTLFLNSNWGSGGSCDFLIDGTTKLMLENNDDDMGKVSMDTLDSLLMANSNDGNGSLAELKPLPPFTGYTGHLSINGIPGHHYHAIANQPPSSPTPSLEANNNLTSVTNQNTVNNSVMYKNNGATLYYEVSTTAPDQGVVSSTVDCGVSDIKTEVDYNALLAEDIAAIIGSAIADTTVPNVVDGLDDPNASRDSWMDLDALIDGACISENGQKGSENVQEFVPPINCESASVTLQNLLQHGSQYGIHTETIKQEPVTSNYQTNVSLLQTRLQNGPPCKIIQDCNAPSSTSYINGKDIMLPHTTSVSPPGHVSTTENLLLNGRYIQNRRNNYGTYRSVKVPSPDMLVNGNSLDNIVSGSGINSNFPHTTTSNLPNKKSRNRNNKKNNQMIFDGVGILGKEKPIHRCSICSRGFLNKSNIKVHLRTHTGEKPFRCDVCGKAFRQKAHLIKHQQMHKRVGRD